MGEAEAEIDIPSSPKEQRLFVVAERDVDLTGGHMRKGQQPGCVTYSEGIARIKELQTDPKFAATGYCDEFAYWWARADAGTSSRDGFVRRWTIVRQY